MIGLTMLLLATAAAAGAAGLLVRAVSGEHLLVLRGAGAELRLYERGPDGRYGPLPASGLPAALWRFARRTPLPAPARTAPRRAGRLVF
jgi:hypothetical protein